MYADSVASLPMVVNVTALPSLGYRMFNGMDHCPTRPCGGQR